MGKSTKMPLSKSHPHIAKQADGWDPKDAEINFYKNLGWKCELGHKWKSTIYRRINEKSGCPVCSNRKIVPGVNDFATAYPKLAAEVIEGNPTKISAGSVKIFVWECKKKHRWSASVISRAKNGTGCPYCSGKKATPGVNDLLSVYPELAKLADGWSAKGVAISNQEVRKWKCKKGHKWEEKVVNLTVRGRRKYRENLCKVCRSIAVTHPEIAKFLVEKKNGSLYPRNSERIEMWKCSSGHTYRKKISEMTETGGCPYCHGTKVLANFNDLHSQFPKIAKELQDIDPRSITYGSSKKCEWKCNLGHTWIARVGTRTFYGLGCPYCSNQKILAGFNDLATTNPELAIEAVGWDPREFGKGSKNKVKWKCKLGHTWIATIGDRAHKESGCPYCSGNKVLKGFNDLKTTHPTLIPEINGWDAEKTSAGSGKKLSWKCSLGHEWLASPQSRALHNTNCPYCSGNKVLAGFNDLKTTHPVIAMQAVDWDPLKFTFGSHKKMLWKCDLGHNFKATINGRTSSSTLTGCPFCSGSKVLIGFNDLETTNPQISKEAYKWDPKNYSAGSSVKLWWICSNAHKWRATPNSRTSSGTGCPTCANSGFDPNKKGYLYFLEHPTWLMFQIGITNRPEDRLKNHSKLGWEVLEVRGPMNGHLTQQWETAILRMLKAKGADLANSKIAGKFDGYSEAWSKDKFKAESIRQLMDLTEEHENKQKN
jgi:hypothetical protein